MNRFRPARRPTQRRVYVLPSRMVERIHEVGHEIGAQSEADVVRRLLDQELTKYETRKDQAR